MLKTEDLYLKLQSIVCRFWIEITMINHKPVTAEWFISLETWLKSFFLLWDINWTSMQSLYWFCYLFWTWSQIPVSVSINTRVYSIIRLFNLWWKVLELGHLTMRLVESILWIQISIQRNRSQISESLLSLNCLWKGFTAENR